MIVNVIIGFCGVFIALVVCGIFLLISNGVGHIIDIFWEIHNDGSRNVRNWVASILIIWLSIWFLNLFGQVIQESLK